MHDVNPAASLGFNGKDGLALLGVNGKHCNALLGKNGVDCLSVDCLRQVYDNTTTISHDHHTKGACGELHEVPQVRRLRCPELTSLTLGESLGHLRGDGAAAGRAISSAANNATGFAPSIMCLQPTAVAVWTNRTDAGRRP